MKVIYYLFKYINKIKFFNLLGFKLLKNINNSNNKIIINKSIKIFNNTKFNKINTYKMINNYNQKYYLKFKNLWKNFKKKIINKLGYYIKAKTAYIYLFISLQKIIKKNISKINFIVNLSKLIENNVIKKTLIKKTKYKSKYLYISYLIYSISCKLRWLTESLKIINNKKKIIIINFNISKFIDLFIQLVDQSVQLPYLIPLKIKINKLKELKYTKKYIKAINYLNSQKFCINLKYYSYLLNMDVKELYNLSNIDLTSLDNIKKVNEKVIESLKYLLHLFIILHYRNKSFYFEHFYDWRGRIYQKSWPANNLYTKITAPLYIFTNNLYNNKYTKNKFDTIFWYNSYKIDPMYMLDIRDATNSMFQIAACITYDINLLKYTNIHNDNIQYNIYDYILSEINIKKNYLLSNIGWIHEDNINKINKNLIKNIIMPWSYNESTKASIKKILNALFISYINKYNYIHYWKIATKIYSFIFNIFQEKFKFYNILKSFLNTLAQYLCKNNQEIKINHKISNTHSFIHKYLHYTNKKIYVGYFNNKRKYLNINIINKDKISIKDNKRALVANTIQYLDSIILIQIILKCQEKKIPIVTNHDCFYTTLKYGEEILNFYNKSLYDNLINYNFLNDLITENNINLNNNNKDIKKLKKLYDLILLTRNQNKEYIQNLNLNKIKYSISLGKKYE